MADSGDTKKVIAVAAANFAHIFPAFVLKTIQEFVSEEYTVLQVSTSGIAEGETDRLTRLLERSAPWGLIAVSIRPDAGLLERYRSLSVPVVLIDEQLEGFSTVTSDNYTGGYIAGQRLVKTGRKKPAIISGRMNVGGGYIAKERYNGFVKALEEASVPFNPKEQLAEVTSYSYNEGAEAMEAFIKNKAGIDGIFSGAGDMCALGALKAAREHNVKIPGDIALIGYDDIDAAGTSKPPLTTIKQPIGEMAKEACGLIIMHRKETLQKPRKISHKPVLMVRDSA
ncbi:MAG TPA: LacI family transcriptional regulator [bacterium]|nr:LacI family transcriptional regulator [bacterium]